MKSLYLLLPAAVVAMAACFGPAQAQNLSGFSMPKNAEALEVMCRSQFEGSPAKIDDCYWVQFESILRLGDLEPTFTYMERRMMGECADASDTVHGLDYAAMLTCFDTAHERFEQALGN